jgi:hypothetical protein
MSQHDELPEGAVLNPDPNWVPPTQPTPEEIEAALGSAVSDQLPLPEGGEVPDIRPAPEWTELNPMLAFAAGKESIQLERAANVEIHLAEQKVVYERVLRENPGKLVDALLDRDRIIAQVGREIADGRMGGKMLREFVRAALASADRAADPVAVQKFMEQALGAEKADLRQLKLKGTTL